MLGLGVLKNDSDAFNPVHAVKYFFAVNMFCFVGRGMKLFWAFRPLDALPIPKGIRIEVKKLKTCSYCCSTIFILYTPCPKY